MLPWHELKKKKHPKKQHQKKHPSPQKQAFKSRPFRGKKNKNWRCFGLPQGAREAKWLEDVQLLTQLGARASLPLWPSLRTVVFQQPEAQRWFLCCFTSWDELEICWWQKTRPSWPKRNVLFGSINIYIHVLSFPPSLCVHGKGSFYIFIIIVSYKYSELEIPVETAGGGGNYHPRLNVSRISMSFNSLSLRRHCGRATK